MLLIEAKPIGLLAGAANFGRNNPIGRKLKSFEGDSCLANLPGGAPQPFWSHAKARITQSLPPYW